MLGLKAPTISHHLTRLRDAGLVTMRGDGNSHLYRLDAAALRALRKSFGGPRRVASLVDDADFESWERKVLATFVDADEKLVNLPTSRKKRRVILEWLVEKFDRGRRYPEKELNEVLLKHHWDSATLRREMVATALLERKKAGV